MTKRLLERRIYSIIRDKGPIQINSLVQHIESDGSKKPSPSNLIAILNPLAGIFRYRIGEGWYIAVRSDELDENFAQSPKTIIAKNQKSTEASIPLTFDLKEDLIDLLEKHQLKSKNMTKSEIIRKAISGFDYKNYEPLLESHRQISVRLPTGQKQMLQKLAETKNISIGELLRAALKALPDITEKSTSIEKVAKHNLNEENAPEWFHHFINSICDRDGIPISAEGRKYKLTLHLETNRKQFVYIEMSRTDENRDYLISIYTVCGRYEAELAKHALETNMSIDYGAFAINLHDGKEHLVMVDTQLAKTAQEEELLTSIHTLAYIGDEWEEILGSEDQF
jgi:hypothetical protein